MRAKLPIYLFIAVLLLACKPAAQAAQGGHSSSEQPKSSTTAEVAKGDAQSRPRGLTKEYFECKNQAQGVIESAECISAEAGRQDHRLNTNYKKLLGLLDESQKTSLVQAQRGWLVLKEKDGVFEASLFDNSQIENLAAAEREMLYVCERANRIEDWIELVNAE